MAKIEKNEEPQLRNEQAMFLNVASLSLLHLAFSTLKNYEPLFNILRKYDSFDKFMVECGDKTIKELGL